MGKLLLIILLIIGCDTEVQYTCNVGTDAAIGPQNPEDTSRPDNINVIFEDVGFKGDLSYTEDDAVAECEVAYSNTIVGPQVESDGEVVSKPLYYQCERTN